MYLGIEIGGTKLQLGVGPGDGALAGLWRGAVDLAAGAEGIRRQIVAAVPELLARAGLDRSGLRAVGIGFGGPVDDATRGVLKSHQVGGWDSFPLAEWAEEVLGLPAAIGNDADVAGLAEALFGAGQGLSPVFYMTIGSGIGGGLIIDGEIYRGAGKGAAEVGHLRMPVEDKVDVCVSFATLESFASGWGIGKAARDVVKTSSPDAAAVLLRLAGGRVEQISAETVAAAIAEDDGIARWVLDTAIDHLAEALCHVIALLCPRRIVIGGGVSLMGESVFFEPLSKQIAWRVFKPFADCFEVVPAALGEEVVVHGAAALARRRFGMSD